MQSSPSTHGYESWSREDLIARLKQLDAIAHRPGHAHRKPPKHAQQKPFDFAVHPRRKIALKFTYDGQHYSGLEHQKEPSGLPTVEDILFDALVHTRLIDGLAGFSGCGWEKCGRTDRGVSAAGQVVSLWVRSALSENQRAAAEAPSQAQVTVASEPAAESSKAQEPAGDDAGLEGGFQFDDEEWEQTGNSSLPPPSSKPSKELHYVSSLNNVLPATIRVIAWSPVAEDFSARFSCRSRHYKYFFDSRGLDLAAMRDAASRIVGEHDFRNLCKVDPSKQLTTFTRRVVSADINQVSDALYVLDLVGNAFLYNQVRHIMAILFLVGTGMEPHCVVDALFNTDPAHPLPASRPGEPTPPVVPSKPGYQMADPLPLMLWDCAYDASAVSWRADSDANPGADPDRPFGQRAFSNNLYQVLDALQQQSGVQCALNAHFLQAAARFHARPPAYFPVGAPGTVPISKESVLSIPLGAGTYRKGGNYVPLLQRPRASTAEDINKRWRDSRAARDQRIAVQADDGGDE